MHSSAESGSRSRQFASALRPINGMTMTEKLRPLGKSLPHRLIVRRPHATKASRTSRFEHARMASLATATATASSAEIGHGPAPRTAV